MGIFSILSGREYSANMLMEHASNINKQSRYNIAHISYLPEVELKLLNGARMFAMYSLIFLFDPEASFLIKGANKISKNQLKDIYLVLVKLFIFKVCFLDKIVIITDQVRIDSLIKEIFSVKNTEMFPISNSISFNEWSEYASHITNSICEICDNIKINYYFKDIIFYEKTIDKYYEYVLNEVSF